MKVLLTGASGYLGRAVATRLHAERVDVRALVRRPDAPVPGLAERVAVDLAQADGDIERATAGVEVIVHCAAHFGTSDRERYRRVNVAGTHALLRAAARAGVRRFIHVSTIAVYGWKAPGNVVRSDDPCDPHPELRDDYAWSKIAAERWVRLFGERGVLDTVTLRPGIVYGRGRDFVARVWRRIAGPLHLIGGSPRMVLPLVHLDDVVEAVWQAVGQRAPVPRPVNVVGPESPTQGDYLALRARQRGERLRPLYVPFGVLRPFARRLAARARETVPARRSLLYSLAWTAQEVRYDVAPALADLGWMPRITIADGLRDARTPMGPA